MLHTHMRMSCPTVHHLSAYRVPGVVAVLAVDEAAVALVQLRLGSPGGEGAVDACDGSSPLA